MSVLRPTDFYGTVTFLGRVRAKPAILASEPERALYAAFAGVEGEVHAGLTRASCSRVTAQYAAGTTIRNTRQFSILSEEELALIAQAMGLERLDPSLLGASMVVMGIPDFSHVPPGSRLQGPSGATLVVDLENRPCVFPGKGIEAAHAGHGRAFMPAAMGRRGITAWVEAEGRIALGDRLRLHVPDQPAWAGH
ncbi:MAG: MOSC domain-containing protein [Aestuariivirga sp.]